MAGYELWITAAAAKDIDSLSPRRDRQAVVRRIQTLAADPRPPGSSKLAGSDGVYRLRQGRFRILYEIQDDRLLVLVIRVGDRKDVYRNVPRAGSRSRSKPFEPK